MITAEELRTLADAVREDCIRLRRALHRRPALSGQEQATVHHICGELAAHGIPHTVVLDGTGIVATLGTGAEPCVAIRADIDALPVTEATGLAYASKVPGVMHACGHDLHAAILVGTARVLKTLEPRLCGTVKLFFQPMEETTGGAAPMIAAGCMEAPHVSRVLALHVDPAAPVGTASFLAGPMNAAVTDVSIEVRGAACHGAHPESGTDALLAAAHILVALQSVVSRSLAPTDAGVVTIGTLHGGTTDNIVAGEAQMTGTLRALQETVMETLKRRVTRIAVETAAALGATAAVALTDRYPALVNDRAVTERLMRTARGVLGAENVRERACPSLGADDFAFFTNTAAGSYFDLGCAAASDAQPAPLHSPYFCPDEGCILTGILLEAAGAIALLED